MRPLVNFILVFSFLSLGILAIAWQGTAFKVLRPGSATASCSALHIIVARASTEAQGEGRIGQVAAEVCKKVSRCDSYGIVYPATLPDYKFSEATGTAAMTAAINSYHAACPSTPIALLGYSQGAQVVGDVLCGTSEAGWNSTNPVTGPVTDNIIAAIQMGDPTHMTSLPFNVGSATKDGVFPRKNISACAPFAEKVQAYCDAGDRYCDSGEDKLVHYGYVEEYGKDAVEFVLGKYELFVSARAAAAGRS